MCLGIGLGTVATLIALFFEQHMNLDKKCA